MIVIGERINTTRKSIGAAVEKKDAEFIQNEAKKQETAGAHYIDVNCGTRIKDEIGDMEWLVNTIQEVTQLPLCIDSPNHKALDKGLSLVKKKAIMSPFIFDCGTGLFEITGIDTRHQQAIGNLCF